MPHSSKVSPIEKIISILSYFTMGIFGIIVAMITFLFKKRLKYFLIYNITQSIIISLLLAIFKLIFDLILPVLALIPFLDKMVAIFNWFISIKVITIFYFSFSIFELILFIILSYISIGILLGRIFYIPFLSNLVKKVKFIMNKIDE